MNQFQLVLIFVSTIIGVVSAAYFYVSAGIFMPMLQRPLKSIAGGMLVIAVGVLVGAFIAYESSIGVELALYGVPLSAYFYILYIIGSIMIAVGARNFTKRPKSKAPDVSLQEV